MSSGRLSGLQVLLSTPASHGSRTVGDREARLPHYTVYIKLISKCYIRRHFIAAPYIAIGGYVLITLLVESEKRNGIIITLLDLYYELRRKIGVYVQAEHVLKFLGAAEEEKNPKTLSSFLGNLFGELLTQRVIAAEAAAAATTYV